LLAYWLGLHLDSDWDWLTGIAKSKLILGTARRRGRASIKHKIHCDVVVVVVVVELMLSAPAPAVDNTPKPRRRLGSQRGDRLLFMYSMYKLGMPCQPERYLVI
jgi:hypothetical protein